MQAAVACVQHHATTNNMTSKFPWTVRPENKDGASNTAPLGPPLRRRRAGALPAHASASETPQQRRAVARIPVARAAFLLGIACPSHDALRPTLADWRHAKSQHRRETPSRQNLLNTPATSLLALAIAKPFWGTWPQRHVATPRIASTGPCCCIHTGNPKSDGTEVDRKSQFDKWPKQLAPRVFS